VPAKDVTFASVSAELRFPGGIAPAAEFGGEHPWHAQTYAGTWAAHPTQPRGQAAVTR